MERLGFLVRKRTPIAVKVATDAPFDGNHCTTQKLRSRQKAAFANFCAARPYISFTSVTVRSCNTVTWLGRGGSETCFGKPRAEVYRYCIDQTKNESAT